MDIGADCSKIILDYADDLEQVNKDFFIIKTIHILSTYRVQRMFLHSLRRKLDSNMIDNSISKLKEDEKRIRKLLKKYTP